MKYIALLVTAIAAFLTPFMSSSTNIVLPPIGREFNIDAVTLGWIATAYLLAAGIFSVPFGRIADIKGRKKIFIMGLFIYTVGSFLSGIATSAEFLIASRVIQGIGGAMIFTTAMAILTSIFSKNERGKAIGINTGAVYTGLSLGPFLGGYLAQNFGWRSVFLINVPLGILALSLALWKLKGEWADAKGEKFDFIGSILYSFMLLFIIYGLTELSVPFLVVGLVLLLIFVNYESRVECPVLEIRLFRKNLTFSLSSLAALLNYSATFAVGFVLSFYLQEVRGFNSQDAGIILLSQPVIMAIFAPFAGWLSDIIEPKVVASIGMAITTLSLFIFSNIGIDTPISLIVLNLMLLGFGLALFSSPNTNAIMSSVERKFFGIASATVATMRLLGQILSMAIVMLIFSILIGKVEITPEYYPLLVESARVSFIIFTILCFIGIFASLGRGKIR
ncbi:MFS transporter [Methanocaldococcus fervens]|uniref:Major facilitator superfamily MFS_1 n=1 Tax=Methanocaldococcus fervens (strain DSM 4213 / JCM 15782 / AG86) TaxID=573064 RepID=C7P807_METFA|nr:MFS transporter [Methanocaldococcus fervens]ACV24689.1 major facilitator superfamily MFS_1 [Methanocaldococcus fervens AG86]